jgi:hypothetical protein
LRKDQDDKLKGLADPKRRLKENQRRKKEVAARRLEEARKAQGSIRAREEEQKLGKGVAFEKEFSELPRAGDH